MADIRKAPPKKEEKIGGPIGRPGRGPGPVMHVEKAKNTKGTLKKLKIQKAHRIIISAPSALFCYYISLWFKFAFFKRKIFHHIAKKLQAFI